MENGKRRREKGSWRQKSGDGSLSKCHP